MKKGQDVQSHRAGEGIPSCPHFLFTAPSVRRHNVAETQHKLTPSSRHTRSTMAKFFAQALCLLAAARCALAMP